MLVVAAERLEEPALDSLPGLCIELEPCTIFECWIFVAKDSLMHSVFEEDGREFSHLLIVVGYGCVLRWDFYDNGDKIVHKADEIAILVLLELHLCLLDLRGVATLRLLQDGLELSDFRLISHI